MHERTLGEGTFGRMGRIEVKKVFEHECSCCVYNGTLLRDGDWVNDDATLQTSNGRVTHDEDAITKDAITKAAMYAMTLLRRNANTPSNPFNITCIN